MKRKEAKGFEERFSEIYLTAFIMKEPAVVYTLSEDLHSEGMENDILTRRKITED